MVWEEGKGVWAWSTSTPPSPSSHRTPHLLEMGRERAGRGRRGDHRGEGARVREC